MHDNRSRLYLCFATCAVGPPWYRLIQNQHCSSATAFEPFLPGSKLNQISEMLYCQKMPSLRFCSEYWCWVRGRWPRSDAARQVPSVGPRSSGRFASGAVMAVANPLPDILERFRTWWRRRGHLCERSQEGPELLRRKGCVSFGCCRTLLRRTARNRAQPNTATPLRPAVSLPLQPEAAIAGVPLHQCQRTH